MRTSQVQGIELGLSTGTYKSYSTSTMREGVRTSQVQGIELGLNYIENSIAGTASTLYQLYDN